jgi:hypothetical protein
MHTEFWWGKLLENIHLEERKEDGRITLSWIFRKEAVRIEGRWN